MAWTIVKNPETEMYQIFSSIVDAFLLDEEITREEMDDLWLSQFGKAGVEEYNKIMNGIDSGVPHTTYKHAITWERAKMWDTHQAEHGSKTRKPESCGICSDILKDEERDAKKTRK